jgi:hypothetical protein
MPPWSAHQHADLPTLEETLADLALDPRAFSVESAEARRREATAPSGEVFTVVDNVLCFRRR